MKLDASLSYVAFRTAVILKLSDWPVNVKSAKMFFKRFKVSHSFGANTIGYDRK